MNTLDTLILAHFDKKTNKHQLLDVHLQQVASIALKSISSAVQFDVLDNQQLHAIVSAVGKFHDFGKFTDFFQTYIKYEMKHGDLKNHAHISALVLYRYLQLNNSLTCDAKEQEALLFLTYLAVRLHHGHLSTGGLFLEADLVLLRSVLMKQTNQLMKKSELIAACYQIDPATMGTLLNVVPTLDSKALKQMPARFMSRRKHERWYFILVYLFSLLVDSDKMDSAQLDKRELSHIPPDRVLQYLNEKHGKDINNRTEVGVIDRREAARQSIVASVAALTEEQLREYRLFTITAPTGIGKTLSSLQAALLLRERLERLLGNYPRIITAIPFINILQGTEMDYRGTLGEDWKIVVHHQNADFMSSDTSEDVPLDKKMLEVESWEGDIILTTFVQLFQSLITGNNRRLKKLNKLAGSIVILDEVQSIPEKYMPLIGACLIKLGEFYGTRFILMTATQPKIIDLGIRLLQQTESTMPKENYMKMTELLPDYAVYFQTLKRTKIIPVLDKTMDIAGFVDFFLDTWGRRSSVIVVNTIKQSLDLYEQLISLELEDTEIRYLSTNLLPKHRKETIQEVKKMLDDGHNVILVSTQTIEAGVDLDFDVGYRALAPLEAIIQTAGRVNRKGLKKDTEGQSIVCPVYVIELGASHHYVYDLHHLDRTKHFLSAYAGKEIEEREYQLLIENYYAQLYKHPIADDSRTIWADGVMKLDFEIIEQFQLIRNVGEVADVFVEWDETATRLANAFSELKKIKDQYDLDVLRDIISDREIEKLDPELTYFQRTTLLRVVLSRMGNYMIQIRYARLKDNKPLQFQHRFPYRVEAPFYWIPNEDLQRYYNPDTGYMDKSGVAYLI